MDHCMRHMEEPASGQCRSCNGPYCARCLVYSFGPKKPPFCVGCALHASGVRAKSRPPIQTRPHAPAAEAAAFASAPSLFMDDTTHGGPAGPAPSFGGTDPSSGVKASWSERRAQRQAAKAARRAAQEVAAAGSGGGTAEGPMSAGNLEPVLSTNQRRALGRLAADNLARS